jgi:hypothetical protein
MIEQLPQVFILRQQLYDAAHQTQLGARLSPRPDSAQQLFTISTLHQHASQQRHDQQGHCHQHEHPRPCLDALDASLSESQQALAIAEAFFTGETPRIFLRRPHRRQGPVREQVPDAPSAFRITCSGLRQIDAARVSLRVPDSAPSAPSLIAAPAHRAKLAPLPIKANLIAGLGAASPQSSSRGSRALLRRQAVAERERGRGPAPTLHTQAESCAAGARVASRRLQSYQRNEPK